VDGRSRARRASRIARFYLDRQRIQMPAYRGHVSAVEVDRLVDYIHWVRAHPY